VVSQFRNSSKDFTVALDVLAVGQKGIMQGLHLLAQKQPKMPVAVLDKVGEEAVVAVAPKGFRVGGHHNYRLSFFTEEEFLEPSAISRWESAAKLKVGSETSVMPLAKAIAARTKLLPEDGVLLVETSLTGDKDRKRLRAAHLANAVARAYAWQVRPVDPSKPVRRFRCAARVLPEPLGAPES
ncbi:unnamed protein product, partial [Effrenium voratum]